MKYLLIILLLFTISYGKNKKDKNDVKKPDTSYTFSDVEIIGYQDNPTPFYIMDADGGQNMIVDLDRNFQEALKHNTDKELILRITHD